MSQRAFLAAVALGALLPASAAAAPAKQRIRLLEESLLAPCCWRESVAVHQSPVASEMRREIARLVQEGRSDREILDYYIQRYGKRVLREPEGSLRDWLYVIPVAASVFGLGFTIQVIRRLRKYPGECPAPPGPG